MQAKTYLFCAIRPETKFHQYTYATLGFANNASVIKLDPKKATAAASELERKLMKELDEMRELVAQLRKQIAEGGGGGDAKETVAAAEQVASLQRSMTVKIQEIQQEADPSAAAAAVAYEKQKAHLQARGITLSSEVEDVSKLNTPYLINLDEILSGAAACFASWRRHPPVSAERRTTCGRSLCRWWLTTASSTAAALKGALRVARARRLSTGR